VYKPRTVTYEWTELLTVLGNMHKHIRVYIYPWLDSNNRRAAHLQRYFDSITISFEHLCYNLFYLTESIRTFSALYCVQVLNSTWHPLFKWWKISELTTWNTLAIWLIPIWYLLSNMKQREFVDGHRIHASLVSFYESITSRRYHRIIEAEYEILILSSRHI
jgi:hypothetical protein